MSGARGVRRSGVCGAASGHGAQHLFPATLEVRNKCWASERHATQAKRRLGGAARASPPGAAPERPRHELAAGPRGLLMIGPGGAAPVRLTGRKSCVRLGQSDMRPRLAERSERKSLAEYHPALILRSHRVSCGDGDVAAADRSTPGTDWTKLVLGSIRAATYVAALRKSCTH